MHLSIDVKVTYIWLPISNKIFFGTIAHILETIQFKRLVLIGAFDLAETGTKGINLTWLETSLKFWKEEYLWGKLLYELISLGVIKDIISSITYTRALCCRLNVTHVPIWKAMLANKLTLDQILTYLITTYAKLHNGIYKWYHHTRVRWGERNVVEI